MQQVSATTPRKQLEFLRTYYTKELDTTSRELSDFLVKNERKFDGEVYRPAIWDTYKFLNERYIQCQEMLKTIGFFLSKDSVSYV